MSFLTDDFVPEPLDSICSNFLPNIEDFFDLKKKPKKANSKTKKRPSVFDSGKLSDVVTCVS